MANRRLWKAAEQGDLAGVQRALDDGADLNAIDEEDWVKRAALHYASK